MHDIRFILISICEILDVLRCPPWEAGAYIASACLITRLLYLLIMNRCYMFSLVQVYVVL